MTHIANAENIQLQLAEKIPQQISPALRYSLAVAATAAITFMADASIQYIKRRRDSSTESIKTNLHDGDNATYTIPGCRTDGEVVGDMMEPQLSELGNTHNLSYGEGDIDIDSVKQHLLEARELDDEKNASIVALSMGGLVIAEAFRDKDFAEKFGPIDRLILDSSPSGIDDVTMAARRASQAASTLRTSYSASKLSSWAMFKRSLRNGENSHDHHVTDEQARLLLKTTADIPLNTIHNQTKFIESNPLEEGSLQDVDVNQIYYISSESDPVIKTEQALKSYEAAFGRSIIHIIDSSRPEKSHAVTPDYQAVPKMLLGNKGDLALG